MKSIFPSLVDLTQSKYIRELAQVRKLKRYWGTTVINGVEVFNPKKYFYPRSDMDEDTEKLCRFLGIYEDVTAKQEGVRSAWLLLDHTKAKDKHETNSNTELAANLTVASQRVQASGGEIKVSLGAKFDKKANSLKVTAPLIPEGITDTAALSSAFVARFTEHWLAGYTINAESDDPYQAALVMCALRNGVPVEVTKVKYTPSLAEYNTVLPTGDAATKSYMSYGITATIKLPAMSVNASSPLVSTLNDVFLETTPASGLIRSRVLLDDGLEFGYTALKFTPSAYWYKVQTGTAYPEDGHPQPIYEWYLRADFFDNEDLTRPEKVSYFTSAISSDYRKKKREWWETLVVVGIIVVAFMVAGPGGLAAASGAGLVAGSVLAVSVTIAVTLTLASLYIAIAAYAFARMGAYNVAAAMGKFLSRIEPLVQVAGVFMLIYSLSSIVRQGIQNAATEAAREGATATLIDYTIEVAKVVIEQVTGVTSLTNMTTSHTIKMMSFTFDIYKDWQTRDLQKELKSYRSQLAEIEEANEQSRTSDVLKDFIIAEPEVLSRDNSVYASLYDKPYEWWSTPYHTGCIQANSVNALWLS